MTTTTIIIAIVIIITIYIITTFNIIIAITIITIRFFSLEMFTGLRLHFLTLPKRVLLIQDTVVALIAFFGLKVRRGKIITRVEMKR